MGIRFLCETCQRKLNVKAFLAGKRGICPHCGAKVWIPQVSQIPSKKDRVQARGSMDLPTAGPDDGPATAAPVSANPAAFASPQPSLANGGSTPAAIGAAPADSLAAGGLSAQEDGGDGAQVDPIAEAPDAVWYVRPPSGGQYGPASGDVMRQWIAEGRVSADSLVWREGWADWRTAGPVFPSLLGERPGSPFGQTAGSEASPEVSSVAGLAAPSSLGRGSAAGIKYPLRRRKSSGVGLAIVVALALMVLLLAIVLIAILLAGKAASPDRNTTLAPLPAAAGTPLSFWEGSGRGVPDEPARAVRQQTTGLARRKQGGRQAAANPSEPSLSTRSRPIFGKSPFPVALMTFALTTC